MEETVDKTGERKRTVSKQERRLQLIKATMNCVAKRGLASTTMADVTREAGLSLGIVNLHFRSKDKLLEETLRHLTDEYENAYQRAMQRAGPSPEEKLQALVDLDFSVRVCMRKKLALWFAYWGEARSRPTYLQIAADNDNKYNAVITSLAQQIIDTNDYIHVDARVFADGLSAIINGLWLDMLMTPEECTRQQAHAVCMSYLRAMFPGHFD